MLRYFVKRTTLLDFYQLREKNFGDLLDPLVFAQNYRDAYWCARLVHELATFEDGRPPLEDFLASIQGDDLAKLREDLFKAYRDFFPPAVQRALDAWHDKTKETRAQTQTTAHGLAPTSGATAQ